MRYTRARRLGFFPLTHALLGWCIAHLGRPDRSTRLWCVLASLVPDLDAVASLCGWSAYEEYHHVALHNLTFGIAVIALSARWVRLRLVPLGLVSLAFLSHLVVDYFGSGAGWGISPFVPFSRIEYVYTLVPRDVLVPNVVGTVVAIVGTVVIALRCGRTPLELVHRVADRLVVDAIQLRWRPAACRWCEARAWSRCQTCREPACAEHVDARVALGTRCMGCGGIER